MSAPGRRLFSSFSSSGSRRRGRCSFTSCAFLPSLTTAEAGGGGGRSFRWPVLVEPTKRLRLRTSGSRRRFVSSLSPRPTSTTLARHDEDLRRMNHPSSGYVDDIDDSSTRVSDLRRSLKLAAVRASGELPYGTREYRLVENQTRNASGATVPPSNLRVLARLRAHRNILFGAELLMMNPPLDGSLYSSVSSASSSDASTQRRRLLFDAACARLVEVALVDAGSQGEQPQAVATLHGLSLWVRSCLDRIDNNNDLDRCESAVLRELMVRQHDKNDNDQVALEAIRAMATGVPRTPPSDSATVANGSEDDYPSTSAFSPGTLRDGHDVWVKFAPQSSEVQLYASFGAEVVGVEMVLSSSPEYRKSAGGAMARMFFL